MDEIGGSASSDKLNSFRANVRRAFGPNLEKATPANVREFLDKYSEETFRGGKAARIELNESKTTYEEILKDFFARVLERPSDEALIMLWSLALDMSFFTIEQHVAERLHDLFGESNEPPDLR